MTHESPDLTSQFEAFTREAIFDIQLPRSADLEISKALKNGSFEDGPRISTRRNLFFDEKANVLLIVRTSQSKDEVAAILPSLELVLAAHATDAVPQGSGNAASASGKHDLTSKIIPGPESAEIVPAADYTYVVWKPTLYLFRPRARLQRPAVYFTAQLTVSAEAASSVRQASKGFVQRYEALPANVLEPLQYDPSLGGAKIYLSETRITKVAPPAARMREDFKPLRATSKRAHPVVPALFTRIRYSALPNAVLASLHLETSQLISGTVSIQDVHLEVSNATVESLNPLDQSKQALPGDETVLLYRLTPTAEASSRSNVSVQIDASVTEEHQTRIDLEVRWQAQVDLSQTGAKPMYKWSRPLSSSVQQIHRPSIQAEKPNSFDVSQKPPTGEAGIVFNFTAAPTTTQQAEFALKVQCINQSGRARRFALVVIQPKRTSTKMQHQSTSEDTNLIASIFNAPPLERQKPPDVLDLNPDVRIGPLPPGACYETELRFRAMTTGVLELGAVRIVDVDSRQIVDVRELPDVIALEKDNEGGNR